VDNVVYDEFGKVYYESIHSGEATQMAFSSFQNDRMRLNYQLSCEGVWDEVRLYG